MNLFPSFVIDKRRYYAQKSTHLFFILSNQGRNSKFNNNSVQMLLIGLCLGVTLGVAFVPLFDMDCYSHSGNDFLDQEHIHISASVSGDTIHNIPSNTKEERKNLDELKEKEKQPDSASDIHENLSDAQAKNPPVRYHDNIRRPRFFSTELGLRQKLIAGVILSESDTENSVYVERLIAINRTLSSQVNKLLFFVIGQNSARKIKELGISSVIALSEGVNVPVHSSQSPLANDHTRPLNRPAYNKAALKAIKYLGEKVVDQFDYFLITLDLFYINGRTVMKSVKRISITEDVLWGIPERDSCSLETGFVISRRVIHKLSSRADRCLSSSLLNMSANLTKCIQYLANLTCTNLIQGETYSTVEATMSPEVMSKSVTIGPVTRADEIMTIHEKITRNRNKVIKMEMKELKRKISKLAPKTPNPSEFQMWPIGISKPFVPRNRFNILKWSYFTASDMFPKDDYVTISSLKSNIDELDIQNVITSATQYLQDNLPEKNEIRNGIEFHHGYRRFDPTRGGEYILDYNNAQGDIYRIKGIRPLSKIEVVPIPYVTENRRITIVIPITTQNMNEIHEFLDRYFDLSTHKKANTIVIFALVIRKSYLSLSPDRVESIKQLIAQYNENLQKKDKVSTTPASEIVRAGYIIVNIRNSKSQNFPLAVIDTLTKRLVSPNAIILTLSTSVVVKDEFLNRVRMNTIFNWQVFAPIPFTEFNPRLSPKIDISGKDWDIQKNTGYFDSEQFSYLSFYAADYLNVRKYAKSSTIEETEKTQDFSALLYLYLRGSQLHILRAPEPGLKLRHTLALKGCTSFDQCSAIKWGSKAQLGKLILASKLLPS